MTACIVRSMVFRQISIGVTEQFRLIIESPCFFRELRQTFAYRCLG